MNERCQWMASVRPLSDCQPSVSVRSCIVHVGVERLCWPSVGLMSYTDWGGVTERRAVQAHAAAAAAAAAAIVCICLSYAAVGIYRSHPLHPIIAQHSTARTDSSPFTVSSALEPLNPAHNHLNSYQQHWYPDCLVAATFLRLLPAQLWSATREPYSCSTQHGATHALTPVHHRAAGVRSLSTCPPY